MSSPAAPPAAPPPAAPPGIRLPSRRGLPPGTRLQYLDVTWAEYRALRDDPAADGLKLTYDGPTGLLEVEMPHGPRHESISRLLYTLILTFRQHGGPAFWPTGAVTLSRDDVARGLDCDESFYFGSLDGAPDLDADTLDLSGGLRPPDVAAEIDVTSPGVAKLPLYAALGVPEVWVWDEPTHTLTCRRLTGDGGYEETDRSGALPGFPLAVAADLICDRGGRDAGELQAAFADRLRAS